MKSIVAPLILVTTLWITACSSIVDPNTNELAADKLIAAEKYSEALTLIEPAANNGYPWAQLRLGIAYEYGQGKTQSYAQALQWYGKASVQMKVEAWADGLTLLSVGKNGFFNQNNDAKTAQYLIARIYSVGGYGVKQNFAQSWLWAQYVQKNSGGDDLLFCCENSVLHQQKIEYERIPQLIQTLEKELSPTELSQLEQETLKWKPTAKPQP